MTEKDADKPAFANDTDGLQAPSIETTPSTIPQTPLPGRAPSRPEAGAKSEVGEEKSPTGRPSTDRRP
ncbi:hypothetical protein [Azospirillum rugosum]|uniref:Uncharacterized protein n=1 Tax=Azospirillum rugosum TaxID=416170 RepID=A0ABS4SKP7_9PROT|nr:hypothetical protein [Azospirillum rugosum]MBP2293052.1 hypothetical protein [Azospirillum rugosum]MDQ0526601.1 hypothetical protein [Azospirillum rugosum]